MISNTIYILSLHKLRCYLIFYLFYRLSNLQNINRSGLNEGKRLGKERHREKGDLRSSDADVTGLASPDASGGEFAPSDDEDVNVEDELPPPVSTAYAFNESVICTE